MNVMMEIILIMTGVLRYVKLNKDGFAQIINKIEAFAYLILV
jgi:hypothetical protein